MDGHILNLEHCWQDLQNNAAPMFDYDTNLNDALVGTKAPQN